MLRRWVTRGYADPRHDYSALRYLHKSDEESVSADILRLLWFGAKVAVKNAWKVLSSLETTGGLPYHRLPEFGPSR